MGAPLHSQFLFFSSLILLLFSFNVQLTLAMSTITAMAKDQISCTMCSSCDNPCQPILSPSPPPPSPPPPASSGYNCPPPPSPPSSCTEGCSLPPPSQPTLPPPNNGGGSGGGGDSNYYYPPMDPSLYSAPPPPNPIVPYFPFYYYNPPPSNTAISKSVQFKNHHPFIILSVVIFLFL
ncbi:leucine-rich repeat extensin-like protein 3 [Lycium ferocissimum]|uniref:leucine-rich repeat extensin-like protein 3 n=1 Tax=Lycium ferocissimum TaxID=112874 RepID=UPI0028157610|nr:leucine-rich repeat extensin-like protein 3 [Lycium ferocissimum]